MNPLSSNIPGGHIERRIKRLASLGAYVSHVIELLTFSMQDEAGIDTSCADYFYMTCSTILILMMSPQQYSLPQVIVLT